MRKLNHAKYFAMQGSIITIDSRVGGLEMDHVRLLLH